MDYKFSIIIPVWNLEKYIGRCLDSAINQTFKGEYEIIVCLGDSHDNTENIVKERMSKHNNIRIIQCGKQGIMDLRLKGVKESNGEYLAFLDADDYYEPTFLETMYKEISKGYDIVNCSFFYDKGEHIKKNKLVFNKEFDSVEGCKALLFDASMRSFIWSKVYRHELFDFSKLILPKTKEHFFEDTMFMFEIFMRAEKIKSIKNPLYHYVNNPTSVTSSVNPNRFIYHLSAFIVIKILCEQNSNKKYIKVFHHELYRSKLSLRFDAFLIKKSTHKSVYSIYKEHRIGMNILKSKKPTNLDNYEWKQYVLDCLKPIE